MAEDGSLYAPDSKWKMPLFVFFRDARLVFKLDALGRELLGIALPAALAVAADPIASLIDTAFIGHLGSVELAAAGVSIALFNQASRITIFPLVSITTSFVAEEDTIRKIVAEEDTLGKISNKAAEKGLTEDNEAKANVPAVDMLQDVEKGPPKIDSESLGMASAKNNETKEFMPKSFTDEIVEQDTTRKADIIYPIPDDTNAICTSFSVTVSNNDIEKVKKRHHIASASTALLFGAFLGLFQAATLILAAKPLLGVMGVKPGSPMLTPAQKYLRLRSLGAPAVLLSLAMQGIFRGFKDTKTPLYVIVLGYATNVALDPILIFSCKLGISGAAIAHVISQYMMALLILTGKSGLCVVAGGLLLVRVVAVTFCVTLAASLAARLGSTPMAAFQTCLQVWLTSSLLADGLAVSIQAILACSFAERNYNKAIAAATRVIQMSVVLGMGLALLVGVGLYYGAGIFSKDANVLYLIRIGIPFVAATQPINSLAFVFDGVNFGASDYAYSAYSLVMVSIASVASLFLLYRSHGFLGIWIALTIYMVLRTFAGVWRMGTGTGPWHIIRGKF
ncbi:Protein DETOXIFICATION [Quillaja saponaria]|uniref:Protein DETOXIFICATION n=1 Tax=Quillaja saponaria TaxID=32244 RepID=A0AAD7VNX3_QUISA|nr:Protein DETOXIFICATION [Quillaja saponaria]